MGTVYTAAGQTQITARGMYGSILLHEDAGGYVLVGVISFATAVMITVLCIRLREREHRGQGTGKETHHNNGRKKIHEKAKNSVLCGAALQFHGIFSGLHAGIGSRNRTSDESPDIHRVRDPRKAHREMKRQLPERAVHSTADCKRCERGGDSEELAAALQIAVFPGSH